MKIRSAVVRGLLLSSTALLLAPVASAETYQIDPVHSTILFRIKHLNTSYSWGRFNQFSGKLNLDPAKPDVNVQVKVDSLDTGNAKRDQHLNSPDFFNSKQFPTISFQGNKVSKAGDGRYELDGTLTLHGTQKPIKLTLEPTGSGKAEQGTSIAGFEGRFNIKRSDYGMKFMLEGVGDDVTLVVSLECSVQ